MPVGTAHCRVGFGQGGAAEHPPDGVDRRGDLGEGRLIGSEVPTVGVGDVVKLDIDVERRCEQLEMPPAKERVLALILREAVTNILRHSQAKTCRLALYRAESAYRLEISDDGRGGEHAEGIGMSSIRTRAEALGGTAVWSSAAGTHLAVQLPAAALEQG